GAEVNHRQVPVAIQGEAERSKEADVSQPRGCEFAKQRQDEFSADENKKDEHQQHHVFHERLKWFQVKRITEAAAVLHHIKLPGVKSKEGKEDDHEQQRPCSEFHF